MVPQGVYEGKARLKTAPANMTWPALMAGLSHFTPHGGHQNATAMFETLWGVVYWGNGKAQMRKDCATVYWRCRGCASGKRIPRNPARLKRTKGKRPFLKVQIDLYEVTPQAPDGTTAILTLHCTYSRYPFFRKVKGKTAKEVATQLFDIVLDMGVVPQVVQSDLGKEFVNELLSELLVLLGSTQVFSSAVHPQSQGITERPHRDLTALLAILIQNLVESRPDTWTDHVRTLECRCRDKIIGKSGCTPRSIIAGWFNVTPLQSALSLLEEIPPDLPFSDWVRQLVSGHQTLSQQWEEWTAECDAKEEEYYNERNVRGQQIKVGELVLLQKAEGERRSGGKLLPRADGPYQVLSRPSEHTATLGDPWTAAPILEGRTMPVARCIRFDFPRELLQPAAAEMGDAEQVENGLRLSESEFGLLQQNEVVCYGVDGDDEEGTSAALVIVDMVHPEQQRVSGRRLKAQGSGPWRERLWQVDAAQGEGSTVHLPKTDLLCVVELQDAKLTAGSIEAMRKVGVVL